MEIVCLTASDCSLLAARVSDHDNSHRRMTGALKKAGRDEQLQRIRLLRRIERRFMIDLGSLCHRYLRRGETTHPLERMVLSYLVHPRTNDEGREDLWVMVDRVREVRDAIGEGQPADELA